MSKYNIIVETISLESAPFSATATIDGVPFESRTIFYNGQMIWKICENGMCPAPTSLSQFSRGQRAAAARWLKRVEQNADLLGKPSQMAGASHTAASSRTQQLQAQNEELQARLAAMEELLAKMAEK